MNRGRPFQIEGVRIVVCVCVVLQGRGGLWTAEGDGRGGLTVTGRENMGLKGRELIIYSKAWNALKVRTGSFCWMWKGTGSQWKAVRHGIMCSECQVRWRILAAEF